MMVLACLLTAGASQWSELMSGIQPLFNQPLALTTPATALPSVPGITNPMPFGQPQSVATPASSIAIDPSSTLSLLNLVVMIFSTMMMMFGGFMQAGKNNTVQAPSSASQGIRPASSEPILPAEKPAKPGKKKKKKASETEADNGELVTKLSGDKKERVKQLVGAAKRTFPDDPILQKLAVSQALAESGLHTDNPSKLATRDNNLFGIKKPGTAGTVSLNTTEYGSQGRYTINAKFGKNKTVEDSFKQLKEVYALGRYKGLAQSKTVHDAVTILKKGGYATSPTYVQLVDDCWEFLSKNGHL